jgi:hypothetical protein
VPPVSPNDPLSSLLDVPGVADAVVAARTAVDTLLSHRILRRRAGDVSAESSLRGAWASAWLAGARTGLPEFRAGTSDALADPIAQGTLRVHAELASLADTWSRAPRQALARLHVVAAADLVSDRSELGRPTAGAADRMDTLAQVLATTAAPAPIVAAIVHGEILALDAFAPASGVVARAAARLTLLTRGLDPRSLVVLEVGHRDLATEYGVALDAYREATPDGLQRWIVHCCEAMIGGAREATAICEALLRG